MVKSTIFNIDTSAAIPIPVKIQASAYPAKIPIKKGNVFQMPFA